MFVFPLPSLELKISDITNQLFSLLNNSNIKSDIAQSCFKALTIIIRDCKYYSITDKQLTILLEMIKNDLEELENQSLTFNMLKSIVSRKLLSPLIYDLMTRISTEMMLYSSSKFIRNQSISIFMQFLLNYPIGSKRLRQHFDFLTGLLTKNEENNQYPLYPDARESIIIMFHDIFQNFPNDILNPLSEYFFLPLTLQLNNESEPKLRIMISKTIRVLLEHIDVNKVNDLFTVTMKWYCDFKQPQLQKTSALLMGIFVESLNGQNGNLRGFDKYLNISLDIIYSVIHLHEIDDLYEEEEEEEKEEEDNKIESKVISIHWERLYSTLLLFEKIILSMSHIIIKENLIKFWKTMTSLILHPHQWVRVSVNRIFGFYFSQRSSSGQFPFIPKKENNNNNNNNDNKEEEEEEEVKIKTDFLSIPGQLFEISRNLCEALQSNYLTDSIGEQIIKNLLFVCILFYKYPSLSNKNVDIENLIIKDNNGIEEEEIEEENNKHQEKKTEIKIKSKLSPLHWIFRRMSYMSRKEGYVKVKINFFLIFFSFSFFFI